MKLTELKTLIRLKTVELEAAVNAGLSRGELLLIYKELKQLHYQKVQAEITGKFEEINET